CARDLDRGVIDYW
nr:immunoglobulin heavy chain junction region [Macaca mulatta]MOV50712.1 immunoglobulin heavy chain junction region [Macaca mulatta]MOV51212.1 immunoglobulin heavy chain junction region [Macaca mulatta]MOV52024.1 immunoglobulin heavy chain junction region [Macaca mulatta]MOV53164.1 immunoglobulin heavy chain junction region [Macaca mulatta]